MMDMAVIMASVSQNANIILNMGESDEEVIESHNEYVEVFGRRMP